MTSNISTLSIFIYTCEKLDTIAVITSTCATGKAIRLIRSFDCFFPAILFHTAASRYLSGNESVVKSTEPTTLSLVYTSVVIPLFVIKIPKKLRNIINSSSILITISKPLKIIALTIPLFDISHIRTICSASRTNVFAGIYKPKNICGTR